MTAVKKSRYFYKDRNSKDSLIHAGPVWDFDWAWKDILECPIFAATDGSGWSYRINDCYPDNYSPDLYHRMLQDPGFAHAVCSRYEALRGNVFSKTYLYNYIDSVAALVGNAQQRHFERWPILGVANWTPEAGGYPATYGGEIQKLKGWIDRRLDWLDENIPTLCPGFSGAPTVGSKPTIKAYPNPATHTIHLEGLAENTTQIYCTNALGQVRVLPLTRSGRSQTADLSTLPNGMYWLWSTRIEAAACRVVKF